MTQIHITKKKKKRLMLKVWESYVRVMQKQPKINAFSLPMKFFLFSSGEFKLCSVHMTKIEDPLKNSPFFPFLLAIGFVKKNEKRKKNDRGVSAKVLVYICDVYNI